MNEKEISKEHMDALKALADTNVKIGEAKGDLLKMKEDEENYLKDREKKAEEIIQGVIERSEELLRGVKSNYLEVRTLLSEATSFAGFISEMAKDVAAVVEDFEDREVLWNKKVEKQEEVFEKIRKEIKEDQILIKNDKGSVAREVALMGEAKKKLADERGTLDRAINRLKEGRI